MVLTLNSYSQKTKLEIVKSNVIPIHVALDNLGDNLKKYNSSIIETEGILAFGFESCSIYPFELTKIPQKGFYSLWISFHKELFKMESPMSF